MRLRQSGDRPGGAGRIEREYGLGRGRTDLMVIWPYPGGVRGENLPAGGDLSGTDDHGLGDVQRSPDHGLARSLELSLTPLTAAPDRHGNPPSPIGCSAVRFFYISLL